VLPSQFPRLLILLLAVNWSMRLRSAVTLTYAVESAASGVTLGTVAAAELRHLARMRVRVWRSARKQNGHENIGMA